MRPDSRINVAGSITIIAALMKEAKTSHEVKGAAAFVAKLTQDIGAPVSENTVRTVLTKIPDALERRRIK